MAVNEGLRAEHVEVDFNVLDENGMPAGVLVQDACQYIRMEGGNTVPAENSGVWYGEVLAALYLYPLWFDESRCVNKFTGANYAAKGFGTIGGSTL